ncbi:MAG: hypothetical protein EBR79_01775 [Proteobacteria bacterium]|nr:hypothetical protein [Pseudomonadota bacterium]
MTKKKRVAKAAVLRKPVARKAVVPTVQEPVKKKPSKKAASKKLVVLAKAAKPLKPGVLGKKLIQLCDQFDRVIKLRRRKKYRDFSDRYREAYAACVKSHHPADRRALDEADRRNAQSRGR